MEKITILFFIAIVFTQMVYSQSSVELSPKINLDFAGSHEASALGETGSLDVNTSITLGIEVTRKSESPFTFGIGASYLLSREQELEGSGEFYFVPVYAIGRLKFGDNADSFVPSVVANLGYNILYDGDSAYSGGANLSGGLYFGAGLRVNFNKIFIEGLFKSFQGTGTVSSIEIEVNYTTLSIGVGFII